MPLPSVSVITVTFRDLPGLKKTRQSVLAQEYAGTVQHVVIDGGSGPEVREYLASEDQSRLDWISEPDDGIYDAMNKGIVNARGDVLWFMNSADVFGSKLSLQQALAGLANPRETWGYGFSRWLRPDGSFDSMHGVHPYNRRAHVLGRLIVPHQASFFGTELLDRIGNYPLNVPIAADQVLMMRASAVSSPVFVPEFLCTFDMQGVSTARSRTDHYRGIREARRDADIHFYRSHVADDAASYAIQALEKTGRGVRRLLNGSKR
jgi:glycosyltransferase involved in cell wall biosynthesis